VAKAFGFPNMPSDLGFLASRALQCITEDSENHDVDVKALD
jgi:hypothetical protein